MFHNLIIYRDYGIYAVLIFVEINLIIQRTTRVKKCLSISKRLKKGSAVKNT